MTEPAGGLGGGLSPDQERRLLQYASESAARQAQAGQIPARMPLDEQLAYFDSQIAALNADASNGKAPDYPDPEGASQYVLDLRNQLAASQAEILRLRRYNAVLETAVLTLIDGVPNTDGMPG
jgi:hypothetical protein